MTMVTWRTPKITFLNFWGTSSGHYWPYIILLFKCFSNGFFYFIEETFVDKFAGNKRLSGFESNIENYCGILSDQSNNSPDIACNLFKRSLVLKFPKTITFLGILMNIPRFPCNPRIPFHISIFLVLERTN